MLNEGAPPNEWLENLTNNLSDVALTFLSWISHCWTSRGRLSENAFRFNQRERTSRRRASFCAGGDNSTPRITHNLRSWIR
jgi:hypothetical protein